MVELDGHRSAIKCAVWNKCDNSLLSCADDNELRLVIIMSTSCSVSIISSACLLFFCVCVNSYMWSSLTVQCKCIVIFMRIVCVAILLVCGILV